jgi:nitronate monooxygenase
MGTRFVATHECDADDAFKQTYIDAQKDDMVIIKSPVGMPGRAVGNAFIDAANQGRKTPFKCPYQCLKTCNPEKSPYCIAIVLGNARKGRLKHGFAFAGENAYRVESIISVKELMDELISEYHLADIGSKPKEAA